MNRLKSFYKYYSITSGLKTLKEGRIKWSSPYIFNDPFDNQCNILFDGNINDLNDVTSQILQEYLLGNKKHEYKFDSKISFIMKQLETVPKEYVPKIIGLAKQQNVYTEDMLNSYKNNFNNRFKELMRDSSIFCFSEDYDNILMWSHYAEEHTGIVINFKDYPPADSPIKLAKKVKYTDILPTFSIKDILYKNITIEQIHDAFTLTKAKCWEYEKEWRIVTSMRNPLDTFEIIPFDLHEVQNVYLGCRIQPEAENQVINIIKTKYPWAKIYKGHKSSTKFALEFSLLN